MLLKADYARVAACNLYLSRKYDPHSLTDRLVNRLTGAMHESANVLTESERAEHAALTRKIRETLDPPPTASEARLDAMLVSPIGAIASVAVRAAGGSQQSEDAALGLGAAAEGIAASIVGARAEYSAALLGAQSSQSTRVVPPIKDGKQGLHVDGHENYDPNRSTLTADPSSLAIRYSGHGQPIGDVKRGLPGFKERFDAGKVIGTFRDDVGNAAPTTKGVIVYARDGIHIYPVRP